MTISSEELETLRDREGSVGVLARLALKQRRSLSSVSGLERQVRDLTAENKRLRRRIAELESVMA